jgi:asparagine synthase (glutamine-hydrolysing)
MERPKRGFGIPIDLWSKDKLLPETRKLISDPDCRLSAWIDPDRLNGFLETLEQNYHAYQCWGLFILEIWLRHHKSCVAASKPMPSLEPTGAGPRLARSGAGVLRSVLQMISRLYS